ncbi:MAG: helix-turn-helix domain-containing protein [Desulfuromonadaceae bacterium]|nr:helix-turn-helix domain-containing protein [Desulfuromonadaceae bacterium]
MSVGKTWFTLEEAQHKFGIARSVILEWVSEGLVRAEREEGRIVRINVDDLQLQVDDLTHR